VKKEKTHRSERQSIKPVSLGRWKVIICDLDGGGKHDHAEESKDRSQDPEDGFDVPSAVVLAQTAAGLD